MTLQNKRLGSMMLAAGILLLIPLIAMQYTSEVNWTFSDFVVGGVLLFGTAALIELALRKVKKTSQRIVLCGVILFMLLLVWAELAVGVFGTPFAGN